MANAVQSSSAYVDTAGLIYTGRVKIAHIVFTPDAAFDALVLRDGLTNGGVLKLSIKAAVAKDAIHIDLSTCPIQFQDGVYASVITAGAIATVVFTQRGEAA
jgi:hypothetical protein